MYNLKKKKKIQDGKLNFSSKLGILELNVRKDKKPSSLKSLLFLVSQRSKAVESSQTNWYAKLPTEQKPIIEVDTPRASITQHFWLEDNT